jgi:tRNA pseudouridine55 synthase
MITKKTIDNNFDFQAGEILLVDKPRGWTSFKAVKEIRNFIKVKKVGHAGTLDPMATGLLIICTGKKTKDISSYQNLFKSYKGIISLGKTTASMDTETEIIKEMPVDNLDDEKILLARNKFLGKINQIPPMYSALKVNGKPLYKLARQGKEIKREAREIEIYKFEITKIVLPDIWFEINCSRGTYIRSIANDLGNELGCGGILSDLRRTAIGEYSVDDAFTPEEFFEKFEITEKNV